MRKTVSDHLYHIRLYLVASLSNLTLIDIEMRKTVSDHLYHIRLYLVASLSNLRLIDIEMRQYLITFTTSGYI